MESKRTIKELFEKVDKVYFYLPDDETKKSFAENADREGFVYRGSVRTRDRKPNGVMSIDKNGIICVIGMQGNVIMRHFAEGDRFDNILCIDYKKYISSDDDYYFKGYYK